MNEERNKLLLLLN